MEETGLPGAGIQTHTHVSPCKCTHDRSLPLFHESCLGSVGRVSITKALYRCQIKQSWSSQMSANGLEPPPPLTVLFALLTKAIHLSIIISAREAKLHTKTWRALQSTHPTSSSSEYLASQFSFLSCLQKKFQLHLGAKQQLQWLAVTMPLWLRITHPIHRLLSIDLYTLCPRINIYIPETQSIESSWYRAGDDRGSKHKQVRPPGVWGTGLETK